jgi:hypothetical protein
MNSGAFLVDVDIVVVGGRKSIAGWVSAMCVLMCGKISPMRGIRVPMKPHETSTFCVHSRFFCLIRAFWNFVDFWKIFSYF